MKTDPKSHPNEGGATREYGMEIKSAGRMKKLRQAQWTCRSHSTFKFERSPTECYSSSPVLGSFLPQTSTYSMILRACRGGGSYFHNPQHLVQPSLTNTKSTRMVLSKSGIVLKQPPLFCGTQLRRVSLIGSSARRGCDCFRIDEQESHRHAAYGRRLAKPACDPPQGETPTQAPLGAEPQSGTYLTTISQSAPLPVSTTRIVRNRILTSFQRQQFCRYSRSSATLRLKLSMLLS